MWMILALLGVNALAADVIWLEPGSPDDRALVATEAGPGAGTLKLTDLRAGATRVTEQDDEAYARLDAALAEVRQYETKLDGELVIMQDLADPIANIGIVRNKADRDKLFKALAYQGFAVNRFFEADLASDDRGAPYRFAFEGVTVEGPWMDAIAMDPERDITPYDIAEAPQRVAYGKTQEKLSDLLPGLIAPGELPDGAVLVVDGRPTELPATGTLKVRPGRHLVHVELDGQVIARHDVVAAATKRIDLPATLSDEAWTAFVNSLVADGAPTLPPELVPSIEALGGEVWAARPADKGRVTLFILNADAISIEELVPAKGSSGGGGEDGEGGLSLSAGAGAGWFMSDDFYQQDPNNVSRLGTSVNVAAASFSLGADYDVSLLRVGAGVDFTVPTEAQGVAFTGDGKVRLRAHPHIAVGVPWAQVSAGYMFPYHPALGGRLSIPVGPVEILARTQIGIAGEATRDNDTTYEYGRLYSAWLGVGYRLKP